MDTFQLAGIRKGAHYGISCKRPGGPADLHRGRRGPGDRQAAGGPDADAPLHKEYAVKKMKSVVELVDVMKVSDEESILLTGAKSYEQAAEEILAMGPKLVAITLGEQGVLMATKSRKEIIKAFQAHAVDTTGAGDSFWGGVLCSILSINKPVEKMEWEEIRKCAVLGNAVAGLCVQKRGGIPAIPTKDAVFEFMQRDYKSK